MTDNPQIDPFTSLTELAERIHSGDFTPTAAVETYLDRIKEEDDKINAYTNVIAERARAAAKESEEALDADEEVGPLHGVPIALKDLGFAKEGVQMTSGSQLMAATGFTPGHTAPVVKRLEDAGAIVLGMTNTPEMGHKTVTDNDVFGPTATPFNTNYNAGGSSGGSAAAVGAGMAAAATGSDMAGSIRIPAAACGVFGLKPSYGLVPITSRPNAFDGGEHHVTFGPITRSVEDTAVLMDVMSGMHPGDPSSVPVDIDYTGSVDRDISDLRIGYTTDMGVFDVDESVTGVVDEAVTALEDAGATVEAVSIDHGLSMEELLNAALATDEFVKGNEIFKQTKGIDMLEHEEQVSDSLIELVEMTEDHLGTESEAAADLQRTQLYDAVEEGLAEYDLIVTPTMATEGLDLHSDRGLEFEQFLTWPFNLTGHPASSVPAGLTGGNGLPVGMQIVGQRYSDDTVLAASAAVERQRPWESLYPRP